MKFLFGFGLRLWDPQLGFACRILVWGSVPGRGLMRRKLNHNKKWKKEKEKKKTQKRTKARSIKIAQLTEFFFVSNQNEGRILFTALKSYRNFSIHLMIRSQKFANLFLALILLPKFYRNAIHAVFICLNAHWT